MISDLAFAILCAIGVSLSTTSLIVSLKDRHKKNKLNREKKKARLEIEKKHNELMIEIEKLHHEQLLELEKIKKELNETSSASEKISNYITIQKQIEDLTKQYDSLNDKTGNTIS